MVNGGFKLWINVYRGRIGEQMVQRMRYILYNRILRFPLPQLSKTSQGEIILIIRLELNH